MRRRLSRAALALALALLAAAVGAAVVFGGNWLANGPNKDSYIREVNEICDFYGSQLDAVPPPDDPAPSAIFEAADTMIPILEHILNEVRGTEPPEEMKADVERFVELSGHSIARLKLVRLEAMERDLYGSALAFSNYEETRNKAQAVGRELGFKCSTGA